MNINSLNDRVKLLQSELQRRKQNISLLTEQLEHAHIDCHTITGHLNELSYLIAEEMKLLPPQEEEIGVSSTQSITIPGRH
jgi:hypothetical protein